MSLSEQKFLNIMTFYLVIHLSRMNCPKNVNGAVVKGLDPPRTSQINTKKQ